MSKGGGKGPGIPEVVFLPQEEALFSLWAAEDAQAFHRDRMESYRQIMAKGLRKSLEEVLPQGGGLCQGCSPRVHKGYWVKSKPKWQAYFKRPATFQVMVRPLAEASRHFPRESLPLKAWEVYLSGVFSLEGMTLATSLQDYLSAREAWEVLGAEWDAFYAPERLTRVEVYARWRVRFKEWTTMKSRATVA